MPQVVHLGYELTNARCPQWTLSDPERAAFRL
jgi:hypothetical protein